MTDFIDVQRASYSDLADKYAVLGSLYEQKQWHQLTVALLEFVQDPVTSRGDNLLQLYSSFIKNVEGKLNQLQLARVVSAISAQYYPTRPFSVPELTRAEEFLASLLDKKARFGPGAFLLLQMEILSLKVKRCAALLGTPTTAAAGNAALDECKKEIVVGKDALEALPDGTEPVVTATVHRVAAEYHKLRGPANLFYDSALLYLGHTPVDSLPSTSRVGLAFDLACAALVGEGIFNFGQVNAHPILASLVGTEYGWLVELLKVFQTGDIDGFLALSTAHARDMNAVPALTGHASVIREKITLLRLMELAASRPAHGRSLSFHDISSACNMPIDGVEALALRALSLGLLKGVMDQVEQMFHVSYVQPRVLSLEQIRGVQGALGAWTAKAKDTLLFLEEHTRELLEVKTESS